jgi:hypothetical protein
MDTFGLGLVLCFICVGVHYEGLSLATSLIRKIPIAHRVRVVVGLIAALFAHIFEVMIFAVGWYLFDMFDLARLSIPNAHFGDHVYFSFTTYTSLGYGDIVPIGPARFIAGIEALLGLVLIAWTASFTYFEMTLYWDKSHPVDLQRGRRRRQRIGDMVPPRTPHERIEE